MIWDKITAMKVPSLKKQTLPFYLTAYQCAFRSWRPAKWSVHYNSPVAASSTRNNARLSGQTHAHGVATTNEVSCVLHAAVDLAAGAEGP